MTDSNEVEKRPRRVGLRVFVVIVCAAGLIALWPQGPLVYLAVGWALFLARVGPQITVNVSGLFTAAVAMTLLFAGLHLALRWFYRSTGPIGAVSPRRWRPKWTAAISALVLVAFAAGIAGLGVTHQIGWFATAPEPLTQGGMREVAGRMKSQNNIKMVALALHNHHSTLGYFPPGFTVDVRGQPLHGWQTRLLTFLEQDNLYNQIQLDRPWDDPANRPAFCREIREFTSPKFGPQFDANGYSLSHYAGNSHVLRGSKRKGLRVDDFKDGMSNTILFGEVSTGFRPWGHPLNLRDPARGLGPAVDTFGGPWPGGQTQFALGDGSVRLVSPNISPTILKALATPAGGEAIPKIDW